MAAGARQSNSVGTATWRTRQIEARCRDIERKGTPRIRIVNCDPDFLFGVRVQCTTWRAHCQALRRGVALVKFAHNGVIAILTFVACAQLLTWPGLPPEAADSETTEAEAASLDSPRPDSSVVERGPEKAGVGGSIPSLATT
jgi:hypothetical protein